MTGRENHDGALLAEFATTGREAPFEELVRRHYPLVLGVCTRTLGLRHDAEDAAQAVFLALAHKANSLQGRDSIAGWLHHVARYVSQNALRLAALRREREREAGTMKQEATEQESTWARLSPFLDRELDALPEKYRLPLILHYMEGRTEEEAARDLKCKTSTLSMRLSRARELLRDRLSRRGVAVTGALLFALLAEKAASAAVPSTVVVSTAKAAALFAAGQAAGTGFISAQASALAEGGLKTMMWIKMKIAAAMAATVILAGSGGGLLAYHALGQERETVSGISTEQLPELLKLIKPQSGEAKWLEVPWEIDVWEARKRAAAEGKPIFFITGGGRNPFGDC